MQKKRVLQLIGSFHQGGSERQAVALTRGLLAKGTFDVRVATLNKTGVLLAEIEQLGLPEIREFRLTSFYDLNFLRQVKAFARYLRNERIDLIHTHDFYTNLFGMAAASLARVHVKIASKRETGGMRSAAQNFIERTAFRRSDAILANSEAVRQYLIADSVSPRKIHVIYNGIDLQRFAVVEDRASVCELFGLPADPDIQFITIVANLRHEVKNIPMLLRVAKAVAAENKKAHFVIAGEGELLTDLATIARDLNVGADVHFIGRCDAVPDLLSISTVCVLTSRAEGFSGAILEYMAAGKPVVATNVGGAREAIIPGTTGYLVEPDDDPAMVERLLELLRDDDKATRFGAAGRRVAREGFSKEAQLTSTLDLYRSLIR